MRPLAKYILILIASIVLFSSIMFTAHADDFSGKLIGDIDISGNYPYIENRIKKYLTIRPSDPYDVTVVNEQAGRIREFYEREGWIGTEVSTYPEYKGAYDSITVHFKVKRGYQLRYKNIEVKGNYSLPTSLVATKINTWLPYTAKRLQESIRRITGYYSKNGYPLAKVRITNKNIKLQERTIDVAVEIEEGPFVSVIFRGNDHLGSRQLKKVITIFRESAVDSFEIEESIKAIQKRYKERGFPNVTVKYDREELAGNRIDIVFDINEGDPQRIEKILFDGNNNIGSGKLRDQLKSKNLSFIDKGIFDPIMLTNDQKRLDTFYRSKGFLDVSVMEPKLQYSQDNTLITVDFPIQEGNQFMVSGINFNGDVRFDKKILLNELSLKVDKPFNVNALEDDKGKLISYYGNHGYPYAVATVDYVRQPNNTVVINFSVISGELVRFGDLSFIGDFLTSQKAIRKAIRIKEGDEFSFSRLIDAELSLRRLGAFNSANIKPIGLDANATIIPLDIKVEEQRPFRLDLDLGYSTDQAFTGTLDFTNLNAFGWGKTAIMRLTGGRKLSRAELGWIDPRLAGYDLELNSNGWLQYKNQNVFTYVQAGGGVGLFRRYHRTSYMVRTEINRNYFVTGSSTAATTESLRNNTILKNSLSMSFDTRNNFANPTKGIFLNGYSNFFDEISGSHANFVKLGFMNGSYLGFWKRFIFANDFRFEGIETFGHNVSVPSNELYLLGGDDTLRGFAENSLGPVDAAGKPTGGKLRFVGNNELRFGIFGNFQLVAFHDMGFLTNDFDQISWGNLRHSVGAGVHYITPIGPIKVDYGFILARKPGEHIGCVNIIFGYIF